MPERTLTVRIIGDDRSLQQAFKRGETAGKGFQANISGLGGALTRSLLPAAAAVVSVQQAFKLVGDSVDEASAINEEVAKSEQVFGASSQAIQDWSSTTASALGISKRQALEATGIFGNLFSAIGIGPKESATLSRSLVELAADMASFNNASPEDVLLALRSGLVGEVEPLRKYGVQLSEARVQQVALAQTGKENVKQLTNQEKAQARYTIIMRDTVKAQGDVSRTSESLANQQRQLAARTKDLEAAVGSVLVPALNILVGAILEAFDAAGDLADVLGKLADLPGIDIAVNITAKLLGDGRAKSILTNVILGQISPLLLATKLTKDLIDSGGGAAEPPEDHGPQRSAGARAEARARRDEQDAKKAVAAQKRAAKAFAELEKGLGLKLSKAGLTASTSDDLAILREWERAILRRIRAEGRTFALVEKLTDVRLQISGVVTQQAQDASDRVSDAFANALDALDLDLEIAKSTRGFADDLRALRAIEAQILKQIAAEGRTTELMRRLFQNRQEQAQALNDAARAAQFEAIGLTAEGDKPTPSAKALLRRAENMQEQARRLGLDTRQLDKLVAFLKSHLKSAKRDVRAAILDMLNGIASAWDEGTDSGGQLTKFAKRGADKLIKGLGLSPEQEREIRSRFSQFGRLDLVPGGGGVPAPGRTVRPPSEAEIERHKGGAPDVIVNVYVDGQRVESSVTRRQQKKRGRNAPQRRGVNPGARR